MIFNATSGTGITATLRYVQGPGKDENGKPKTGERTRCLGGTGFGFDPQTEHQQEIARRLMEQNGRYEMQGSPTKQCLKDCQHISLSWAPGQTPDQAEKLEAAHTFLKALGMENSMTMIYEHTDRSHAHIHMVTSRVNPETGLTYDDYQQKYRGWHTAIEWERSHDQVTKPRQWCHDLADATRGEVDRERLLELLLKNEAVIRKSKLDMSLAFGGHFGSHLEAHREDFIRHHDLLSLKKYRDSKTVAYTTKEIWKEENQILGAARRLHEKKGYAVSEKTIDRVSRELTLTDEQRVFLRHMAGDRGLALGIGEAGTGKSHSFKALRKAYEHDGFRPLFLSTTNKVVNDARLEGHDARTIAYELEKLKWGEYKYDPKTILMPDEAAMMDHEGLLKLMGYADKHGAGFRPIGDPQQLGSVPRGGMFPVVAKRFGAAQLTEVMRNKDPDQKRAFNKMHEREWEEAVEIFRNSDSIRWNASREDSMRALTFEYAKDFLNEPDLTRKIIAPTNIDVDKLNLWARDLLKKAGKIGSEVELETAKGLLPFGAGDRIVMSETTDKKKGLVNGAFGTVIGVTGNDIELQIDTAKGQPEKRLKIRVGKDKDSGEVFSISHGYASTVYKSQGDSIHRTYVMHDHRATAPSNYVALSRHIERVRLFVTREETNSFEHLAEQLKGGYDKTAAHSYLLDDKERAKLDTPKLPAPSLAPEQSNERPKPAPASVRFYHGGTDPTSGGPRWLTPYEDYARNFRSSGPKDQNEVHFVDILKKAMQTDPDLAAGYDDVNSFGTNQYYRNFEAPERIAKQLKPLAKLDRPVPDLAGPSLAPEGITPEPTPEVEQKETGYRNILDKLFGPGEKMEKSQGQAERGDARDDTEATKPGLFVKLFDRGRSLDIY